MLLVKVMVGKIRTTVYDLPPEDHTYGLAVIRNPLECAPNVINHWNVNAASKETVPALDLDYITMNRNSAKIGITTPKGIRDFRKDHPIRRKAGGDEKMYKAEGVGSGLFNRTKAPLPSDKNPQFTYGKPTRPSTPVAHLMTDQSQQGKGQQKSKKQQAAIEQKAEKEKKIKSPKTVLKGSKSIIEKDVSTLFKMKKFTNIPCKIQTHRPAVAAV